MKPYIASRVHFLSLIVLGLWAYFVSSSNTALIPVVLGVILLFLNNGLKNDNKVIAHIAVVITLLAVIGIVKPFLNQISSNDSMGIFRTGLMLITGVWAMITFVQSFIAARKAN